MKKQFPKTLARYRSLLVIGVIATVLSACGTNQTAKTQETSLLPADQPNGESVSFNSFLPIIEATQALPSPQRDKQLLLLSGQLNDAESVDSTTKISAISRLLSSIDATVLSDEEYTQYVLLGSTIFSADDNTVALYQLLTQQRIDELFDGLSREEKILIVEKEAEAYLAYGFIHESLLKRVALDRLLEDPIAVTENNELLWQTLNSLSPEGIAVALSLSTDITLTAWYQLIDIHQTLAGDVAKEYQAIESWLANNPSHPAATELPIDLQLVRLLFKDRPSQIALLLPLKGPLASAANAIREGFFSVYFNDKSGSNTPEIVLIDTSEGDIKTLYDQAVANGANMIIGPLQKEKVAELEEHILTVPTLALNYTGDIDAPARRDNFNFYQFGLSLEDEAKQVAVRGRQEGYRYAMVIASDADWSIRAADSFINEWQTQGGVIVDTRRLSDQKTYSDRIKSLLNISESQSRANQLKQIFGQSFEFEPRRRDDIDMIFLVVRGADGQQIKPILAFHYAGDVPVFATSQLFSSLESTAKTRDLNGITIATLPWVIETSDYKKMINENFNVSPNYERLYALGTDAYLLHNRLNFLSYSSAQTLEGNTGTLSLSPSKRINREQPFAEIIKGRAEPLSSISAGKFIPTPNN